MVKLNESFVVDGVGKRVGVFIDMKTYRRMMDAFEELDDIRAYDESKARGDDRVEFGQVSTGNRREVYR